MPDNYVLLEGTTATIDITFGLTPTASTQSSAKAIATSARLTLRRDTFRMDTFATNGGWAKPIPRMKTGTLHLDGFMSTGGALSDPLALMSQNQACPFLFSATQPGGTAATISGKCIQTMDDETVRALDTSGLGRDFETYDTLSSSWITS